MIDGQSPLQRKEPFTPTLQHCLGKTQQEKLTLSLKELVSYENRFKWGADKGCVEDEKCIHSWPTAGEMVGEFRGAHHSKTGAWPTGAYSTKWKANSFRGQCFCLAETARILIYLLSSAMEEGDSSFTVMWKMTQAPE